MLKFRTAENRNVLKKIPNSDFFFVEPRNFESFAIEIFNLKMKVCVRN